MSLRIAFMGTADFSVPILSELIRVGHKIVAVYSQPPRKKGRGMTEKHSPVYHFAEAHGLVVRTPFSLKSAEEQHAFADLNLDVTVVAAYGLILPKLILETPRLGCLNLHASLLPRWRGAAPIQRAIMAGDAETGVMVMHMDTGLDTGPVLLMERVPIVSTSTLGSIQNELSHVGALLMVQAITALSYGKIQSTPQRKEGVIYAKKIKKDEARIDWTRSAHDIDCHIRGLTPCPGAFFERMKEKKSTRIKVLRAYPSIENGVPGEILSLDKDITIACGDGSLVITELQRAGKDPMGSQDFLRGFHLKKNERLI
jgi:methionyl-tRNA formyltransferase